VDNPHKDGITLEVGCPREVCGHTWRVEAYQAQSERIRPEKDGIIRCPECGKYLIIDSRGVSWRPSVMITATVLMVVIVPVLIADTLAWRGLNRASLFLQQLTGISKWWLSLGLWVVGSALFPLCDPNGYPGFADTTIWAAVSINVLIWAYRKADTDSDEGEEVMTLADAEMIQFIRMRRRIWLGLGFPIGLLMFFGSGDGWLVAFYVTHAAFYWMDSEYLPPERRYLFDMAHKWAFGES